MIVERSTALPLLATGWALLWALLSLSNGGFQPDGSRGLGFPIIVISTGWLFAWLRSDARTIIALRQPGRWTLSALGLVPIVLIGILPLIDHSGRGASSIFHASVSTICLKVALFGSPWILLLFGGRNEALAPRIAAEPSQITSAPVTAPAIRKADTLLIPIGDVMRAVGWRQILWLEANGNYVRVFTHDMDYFYRRSLGDLLGELGEDRFVRIHKSRAVNISEIAGIQPLRRGDAELHLRSGAKLRMSRRFRAGLPPSLRH